MFKLYVSIQFVSFIACCCCVINSSSQSLMSRLAEKISELHINSGKHTGLYSDNVYIHVPPSMAPHKYQKGCRDVNVFRTELIVMYLLEASLYSGIPFVTSQELLSTLTAIRRGQDKNVPYNTSATNFYEQTYNVAEDWWMNVQPTDCNVENMAYLSAEETAQYLQEKGYGNADIFAKGIQNDLWGNDFTINPPDFDSTFSNLAIGTLLEETRKLFPESRRYWMEGNANFSSTFESVKKFAYRPFADDFTKAIAPKSYYFLRHFIHEAEANGDDLSIVTTWLLNEFQPHWDASALTNTIDLMICYRVVCTTTEAILTKVLPAKTLDDPELQKIYLNTTSLIKYMTVNKFCERPDLALSYYGSANSFYWLLSRTLSVIERFKLRENLPHPAIIVHYDTIKELLRRQITGEILALVKPGDNSDEIYFDGVLGNVSAGTNVDDRLSTTAIVLSTLMNTWSVFDSDTKTLSWFSDTSTDVHQTVTAGCRWLEKNILGSRYKHKDAFFTGGFVGPDGYNFWYPTNRLEYPNGTSVNEDMGFPQESYMGFVEGVIPEEEYEAMLNEKHFGVKTPQKFLGMEDSIYLYWSTEAFTYATALLTLSQCSVIQQ